MVEVCILKTWWATEWAFPAFIIPKKDGRVWQITDLCLLNKAIVHKKYPLTIITDMLKQISGYNFLPNSTYQCNITLLSLTKPVKNFLSWSHLLANTNINVFWWDSNMHQTLHNKSWKKSNTMSKTLDSTSTTLVPFPWHGNATSYSLLLMCHLRNQLAWILTDANRIETLM